MELVCPALSIWQLNNGKLETSDVAFSTNEQLIILDGQIDFLNDSIENLKIGLVNKKGCLIISQNMYGRYDSLNFEKIDATGTLMGAVINLADVIVGSKCEPFYKGTVEHPKMNSE